MFKRKTIPNQYYRPDWEDLYDFHNTRLSRLSAEAKDNIKTSADFKVHNLYREQIAADHEICLRCLDTYQHKTVQDYIIWVKKNFALPKALRRKRFSSIDDAKEAIRKIYN